MNINKQSEYVITLTESDYHGLVNALRKMSCEELSKIETINVVNCDYIQKFTDLLEGARK